MLFLLAFPFLKHEDLVSLWVYCIKQMYGAIRDQGKTVTLISGKKHILHDPNPEAMVIGEAIIEE